jgi:pSer/pThr/pTyr-binding forkhead associated (FHA) protein
MKDNNNIKSIHVILLDETNKITMGRGHESDVRINDISVSRSHATLTFENGKIRIRDLKSKFGTLVLIKKDLNILESKIQLQIGRTYLEACSRNFKEYEKNLKNK